MCDPKLPAQIRPAFIKWRVRGMPKRGKREPSFHFLAIRVTQNLTRLPQPVECGMVPVPTRYDNGDMTSAYKVLVNELNAIGPENYEVITVVSVHKPSRSSAFLKLLSIIPDARQTSSTIQSQLETLFTTNVLTAEA
uniref:Uncharacterized protein n=1 Tax=viral metagenome TaxID=1070528 RepID=A0A6C0J3D6_9ZZZZ